jgi:hypothetical protein
MNDPLPDLDPALAALFRGEHAHLPAEPFVGATLRRVAAERERSATLRRMLQSVALIAVLAASPWLIEASTLLSAALDKGFALVSGWLGTPAGMAIAGVAAVILALRYRRRRVW